MYFGENEYIQEQVVLQEFHVSKNDLKDPKYLEKVKEDIKKRNDIISATGLILSIILTIVSGIVTSTIIVPLIAFIPFIAAGFFGSLEIISKLPSYDKRREQIKEKVLKIREKAEKMKDGTKGKQELIDNCNRVLKEIEKQISDEENKRRENKLKSAESIYNKIYNLYNSGKVNFQTGDELYDIFYIAKKYMGISPNKLESKFWTAIKDKKIYTYENEGFRDYTQFKENKDIEYDVLMQYLPDFKANSKFVLFYAIDDTLVAYLPLSKKICQTEWFIGCKNKNDIDHDLFDSLYKLATERTYNKDISILNDKTFSNEKELIEYMKLIDKYHLIKNN